MEAQVASLLLIVASVAFSSVVVGFAAVTMEQTLASANDSSSTAQTILNHVFNQTQNALNAATDIVANQTTTTGP
jgi:hypothetical protein